MKSFLLRILLFFILMIIIDRIVGSAFHYMVENSKGGYVNHQNKIMNGEKKDILIFGSSRAVHHYDAKMIEDSLGLSCYNCGQNGNGIILNIGEWWAIKKRYEPRIVIYDTYLEFDLYENDNYKYLGWLKLYYEDHPEVQSVFDMVDKTERIKMMSKLYQYNYNPMHIINDFIQKKKALDDHGFFPLIGEFSPMKVNPVQKKTHDLHPGIDTLKMDCLRLLLENKGNTKFIFVTSPRWSGSDGFIPNPITDLCEEFGIPFIDFSNDPKYVHQAKYFIDGSHLNEKGAEEYTKDIITYLKTAHIL